MKTLLIDNHDSFTFNVYQLLAKVSGVLPLVVPNDADWEQVRRLDFDAVVLSPGPGRPENARDFGICRNALLELKLPVLGVCLGMQGLAQLAGARIAHAPMPVHGQTCEVLHRGEGLFRGMPNGFRAVRYHSLVVTELPECLERIAWTADGLTMGVRHRERPQWGVQFHPESICSEEGERLISNFLEGAQRRKGVLSAEARVAPVKRGSDLTRHTRLLEAWTEPSEAFERLAGGGASSFWLDSSRVDGERGRFSYLGSATGPEAFELKYWAHGKRLQRIQRREAQESSEGLFEYLQRELQERRLDESTLPFNFTGGFVGYLGYGLKAECGGALDAEPSRIPDAQLIYADRVVAFDHLDRKVYLVCVNRGRSDEAERWFDEIAEVLSRPSAPRAPREQGHPPRSASNLHLETIGADEYIAQVRQCLARIRDGDSYELCLTRQMRTTMNVDPRALYRELREINPAPYAAFLHFGRISVACSSPESFLKLGRDGFVESKPIKGTAPRGATLELDAKAHERLRTSIKDRAENLMIVDLLRNDLGRVCEIGSVTVPKLMEVESFATVHQLVSTVRGKLLPDASAVDCVRAAFPGGSMTGAPKQRSMEILDSLERTPRGIYSGAIGFFGLNGTMDLNIVIRTLVVDSGEVTLGVGGAIVALSDPFAEYAETELKAEPLLKALTRMT